MKIYIASSYELGKETIQKLKSKLGGISYIDAFFPDSIDINADTLSGMKCISDICSEQIKECDMLVAIYPFGISVSIEVGRFLEQQNYIKKKKLIVFDTTSVDSATYKKLRSEVMIMPYVYKVVNTVEELIEEIKKSL